MNVPSRFLIEEDSAGQRLDEFLASRLQRLSRMGIANLLGRGACSVNGLEARAGVRLAAGDAVEVEAFDETPNSMTPDAIALEVVYEDEHLIVVVKPAGVLVHPSRGVKRGTLANALAYHLNPSPDLGFVSRIDEGIASPADAARPRVLRVDDSCDMANSRSEFRDRQFIRPGIVHRLDRDTSGLLVVAKTQTALSRLTQHFQRRLVEKRYLAVLCGRVESEELIIDAPIGRDEQARPRWCVLDGGRPSETRLRVLETNGERTLVELEPVTGRTNQLRIHCSHAGHAVVGDTLYGGDAHARLCLHASRLAFRHPATNERLEFSSPLPAEAASALGANG
ncbi:MAG TPA: RluA family pseudouridine synthase [Pyrinomonadaceae bacterium]|nr:RluA family pseudouridine synthase [Pyrinomonadaceae bacterium]